MVRFLRPYGGYQTDGVKYRRGAEASFLPWQEAFLIDAGICKRVYVKAPKIEKAKPLKVVKK